MRTNVVVGLGNPGSSYGRSRHNVGFRVVDALAERHGLRFSKRDYKSQVATGRIGGAGTVLMKPQTYMNLSGDAVGRVRRALGLEPDQFIVVYDDLDLAVGRVRVRAGGSAGGHHGVESIIEALGSKDFPRVRIGIGRPASKSGNVDFLLEAMTTEEAEALAEAVARGAEAVEAMLADGVAAAMSRFNGQPKGDRRSQAIDRR